MEDHVDIGDVKTFYRVEGSGPAVILIHANGLSSGQWKHNINQLSRYFKVYAPDLPGFGLSDKPNVEYGLGYYVGFLRSFMDTLGIPKAVIVGNSFGGAIAASFASRFPDRITALVLADATGLTPNGISKNKELTNLFLNLMMRSQKLFCRPMFFDSRSISLLDHTLMVTNLKEARDAFSKNCQAILYHDPGYLDSLMSIKAPTLIIWGQDDLLLPPADADKYHTMIANSRVKMFDQCGHMPNVEKHAEFNSSVLDFLMSLKH